MKFKCQYCKNEYDDTDNEEIVACDAIRQGMFCVDCQDYLKSLKR